MKIWALADLHLSFGAPAKNMDVFGENWHGYAQKIEASCKKLISEDDLLLIAGDISWALKLEEAQLDLEWVEKLPGTKVMIRGNHDYWWSSPTKVRKALGKSTHIIQHDVFMWHQIAIGGTRLWDCPNLSPPLLGDAGINQEKLWQRELGRLEISLKSMPEDAKHKIVMVHYPPTNTDLVSTRATELFEKYKIDACIFGHLHAIQKGPALWGEKAGVKYFLTASDYLDFCPIEIKL